VHYVQLANIVLQVQHYQVKIAHLGFSVPLVQTPQLLQLISEAPTKVISNRLSYALRVTIAHKPLPIQSLVTQEITKTKRAKQVASVVLGPHITLLLVKPIAGGIVMMDFSAYKVRISHVHMTASLVRYVTRAVTAPEEMSFCARPAHINLWVAEVTVNNALLGTTVLKMAL
jgi:hypothetical protein